MSGAGQGEGRITLKQGSNSVERDKNGLYMRGAGQGEGRITISCYTPISHAGNSLDIRNYLGDENTSFRHLDSLTPQKQGKWRRGL